MARSPGLVFLMVMAIIAIWMDREASFVDSADSDVSKQDNNKSLEEDNNGKKTQEDIMFGNQQTNKQNFLQSMLGMSLTPDVIATLEKAAAAERNETDDSHEEENEVEKKADEDVKEDPKDLHKYMNSHQEYNEDEQDISHHPWYNREPMSEEAVHYLLDRAGPQNIPHGSLISPVYDSDEVYRRKRQLPIPLKKRSLRSPIGQMIQTRARRMPRQSMRFKRQVDLGQLLSMIDKNEGNDGPRYYDQQAPKGEDFRESSFRFPFNFGRNSDADAEEDEELEMTKDVSPNPFLFSPPSRFMDPSEYPGPYSSKMDDNEGTPLDYPEWMERSLPHPSIFSVSRRSSPLFYPIDYRYIPAFKKRSLKKKDDPSFGKWGRVVQTPSAYATAEDVARLYALANMLAEEGDESLEERIRRSE